MCLESLHTKNNMKNVNLVPSSDIPLSTIGHTQFWSLHLKKYLIETKDSEVRCTKNHSGLWGQTGTIYHLEKIKGTQSCAK